MPNQTSVEWLFHKLWNEPKDKMVWYSILNVAKQMHKQENEDAYCKGAWDLAHNDQMFPREKAEEYYKETYVSSPKISDN